jgi:quinol monooxygenase YgiN
MLQNVQGMTKDQYEQVNQKMFGQSRPPTDQLPEGLILHSAGPSENGWYIYDVWESQEAFQRFLDGPLGAAIQEVVGDQPPPPGSEPQFFPIESLAVAR